MQFDRLRLDVSAESFRLEGDAAVEVYEAAGRLFYMGLFYMGSDEKLPDQNLAIGEFFI